MIARVRELQNQEEKSKGGGCFKLGSEPPNRDPLFFGNPHIGPRGPPKRPSTQIWPYYPKRERHSDHTTDTGSRETMRWAVLEAPGRIPKNRSTSGF